ncbi:malonate--CoA ligase ACSF3, mitochondrial [Culicoides brevitarsis]|uniref:malonate--CoA ligase ACSF3, mitochondrial n=1 Tax=Culicoides brevitarsis TaxID=469753 RepID=UPI00307C49CA
MFLRRSRAISNYLNVLSGRQNFYSTAACNSTKNSSSSSSVANETEFNETECVKRLKAKFDDEIRDNGIIPPFKRALLYGSKIAVKDPKGETSFSRLFLGAKKLGIKISNICGAGSGSRVCFLCPNDAQYVIAQWASWFSGQIAVPLSPRHPVELLEYYIQDCDASLLICSAELEHILQPIATKFNKPIIFIDRTDIPEMSEGVTSLLDPKAENIVNDLKIDGALDSKFYANSKAMILYTSGTTGRPKGVVMTHQNVSAQINSIGNAWHIDDKDTILHVLPLHHFHGVVNGLICPLNVGSKLIMLPQFDSSAVWSYLLNVNMPMRDRISVFMAVPTIYSLLIQEYDKIFSQNSQMTEYIKSHCKNKIRLMISGSAPLPETVFNKWLEITGHKLLERYGMTEIGMALSNPYIQDKQRERRPGTVGNPLPFVEVKITEAGNPKNTLIQRKGERGKGFWNKIDTPLFNEKPQNEPTEAISGDLYIRGPTVFAEYWNKPEETKKEFIDGWFKTGDTAGYENGYFKILGRSSVDIIKTGGFKLSALEIESKLLEHPKILDVAVVPLPDETWGSKVAALIVLRNPDDTLDMNEFKEWGSSKLPSYAFPTVIKITNNLPKNAMGKVNKRDLIKEAFSAPPAAETKT